MLHACCTQAVFDRSDDRADLPLDPVEFLLPLMVFTLPSRIQPVQLAVIFGGELLGQFGRHQVGLQARQYTRLEYVPAYCQEVFTGSAVASVRATIVMQAHFREPAPARS